MLKRLLDVGLSAGGLILLSPILIILWALVKINMGTPVIFQQRRPGLYSHPFTMYKFRTMRDAVDSSNQQLPDNERLTSLGRFLRASSLDELPELFNVLKGEMSLVGPRPLLTRYTPYFTAEEGQRLNVRPGITGWAQVNGRNTVSWNDRLALDVWYVQHRSTLLDLKILWLTLGKIFQRSGVVVDPESVMQNLDDERRNRASL
ncbi:sugar transferase (plasmid) [Deinococcus altitudinis]